MRGEAEVRFIAGGADCSMADCQGFGKTLKSQISHLYILSVPGSCMPDFKIDKCRCQLYASLVLFWQIENHSWQQSFWRRCWRWGSGDGGSEAGHAVLWTSSTALAPNPGHLRDARSCSGRSPDNSGRQVGGHHLDSLIKACLKCTTLIASYQLAWNTPAC